jgi:hypothetical protein
VAGLKNRQWAAAGAAFVIVWVAGPARGQPELDERRLAVIQTALWRGKEPARIHAIRTMSGYVQPVVKRLLFHVLNTDPSVHVRSTAIMVLAPRVTGKDLSPLRKALKLEHDPGLKRLLGNLVMRLENGKGPASTRGEAARVRRKAKAKKKKEESRVAVFFSMNVGMQTVRYLAPLRANVYGHFGLRIRRFEVGLDLGDPMIPAGVIAFGMRASYYSVFRPGFRLRHGASADFLFSPYDDSELLGALVNFYLCDMSIRLSKYTWFEISAFGLGIVVIRGLHKPGAAFGLTIGLRFGL